MLGLILLPAWNEEGEDLMWHFNQKGMERQHYLVRTPSIQNIQKIIFSTGINFLIKMFLSYSHDTVQIIYLAATSIS